MLLGCSTANYLYFMFAKLSGAVCFALCIVTSSSHFSEVKDGVYGSYEGCLLGEQSSYRRAAGECSLHGWCRDTTCYCCWI
jgi:hypothetical protein